ncbi:hypothetical protein CBL_03514 [Carabus blaptoides fortunei]
MSTQFGWYSFLAPRLYAARKVMAHYQVTDVLSTVVVTGSHSWLRYLRVSGAVIPHWTLVLPPRHVNKAIIVELLVHVHNISCPYSTPMCDHNQVVTVTLVRCPPPSLVLIASPTAIQIGHHVKGSSTSHPYYVPAVPAFSIPSHQLPPDPVYWDDGPRAHDISVIRMFRTIKQLASAHDPVGCYNKRKLPRLQRCAHSTYERATSRMRRLGWPCTVPRDRKRIWTVRSMLVQSPLQWTPSRIRVEDNLKLL